MSCERSPRAQFGLLSLPARFLPDHFEAEMEGETVCLKGTIPTLGSTLLVPST